MPSSVPQGRPGHRRSYTTTTFSTEHGPGAFVPLGGLPRRRPQKKFVLNDDEDDSPDDSHDQNDDDSLSNILPKLQLKKDNSFRLSIATATDDDAPPLRTKQPSPTKGIAGVPFPRSSPSSVSAPASAPPTEPTPLPLRPNVTRTTSTPILLSNGKPLKSSLKSSSSSPHIPFPPQQPSNHLRARSAPSSPSLEHPVAKNVHFPTNEEGGLATIRVFNRSAKPASLSRPNGEDTETETEGELSTGSSSGFIRGQSAVFPLPRSPLSPHPHHHQHERSSVRYVIDTRESSAIPLRDPSPYGNVYLESLSYTPHSRSAAPQGLSGTLLVRNIAYEKQVIVRFTLDDWQTTSEVSSRHLTSLSSLPTTFLSSQPLTHGDVAALHSSSSSSSSTSEGKAPEWDRFGFTIKLEDYAANLSKRTMFLVARYTAVGGRGTVESWDNNLGRNYKIAFRETATQAPQRGRTFAVSSPPSFSPSTLMTTSKTATPTSSSSSSSSSSSFLLPAYSPPLSSSSSPSSSTTQPQHAQLVAQTTLLRLKKLNLRNYAAPSSSTPLITPIPPTSSSGTGPASVRGGGGGLSEVMPGAKEVVSGQGTARGNGSTGMEILGGFPAHVVGVPPLTKREESESSEDEDEIKTPTAFEAESRSRTPSPPIAGVGREEFKFPPKAPSSSSTTTTTMPHLTFSSSSSSSPSTSPSSPSDVSTPTLNSNKLMPLPMAMDVHRPAVLSPLEMGTSPPFSMMAEIGSTFAKRRDAQHHHHSLSHPPTTSPSPTAARSSTTASLIKSQLNPSGGGDGVHWLWGHSIPDTASVPQTEEEVKKVLAGIREKNTSSPVRRVSPSSSGRTSPVKASASALTKLPMDGGGAVVGRALSPVKKLEEEEEKEEGLELVSPQPTKKTPDWSKGGSGWNKGIGSGMNGVNHQKASPISSNTPTSSPSPPLSYPPAPVIAATTSTSTPSPNATPTPSSSSTTNDSVYQAFVRQWCFAQGPSPVLGTGTTTGHASLSSSTQGSRYARGRERRGAEGAEVSELVV